MRGSQESGVATFRKVGHIVAFSLHKSLRVHSSENLMVRLIFIFENSGACSLIHVPGFANCIACMFQPNALDIGSRGAGVRYVTCDQHLRQCPWSWGEECCLKTNRVVLLWL